MPDTRSDEDMLIQEVLAGAIAGVLGIYSNHESEYQVHYTMRHLKAAMLQACKEKGVAQHDIDDITISFPHPN